MKTITFEHKEYEVEDWVNFVARDEDGRVYGFEYKPELFNTVKDYTEGRYEVIMDITDDGWLSSLK